MKSIIHKAIILQKYLIDNKEHSALNEFLRKDCYKIEISLNALLLRKNMAFNKIVRYLNYFFLIEFICVILQEQGLWSPEICSGGKFCNIKRIIGWMNKLSS